ncbi:transposase, partial [Methylobacterium nonmethylotrophicum]
TACRVSRDPRAWLDKHPSAPKVRMNPGKGKRVADDQDAAADIEAWITKARTCEAPAIATFASGLEADIAAVRAALMEPWSSGQAEGQVNRLKLIKRQCYGRAGLDLLKRRMVLAA